MRGLSEVGLNSEKARSVCATGLAELPGWLRVGILPQSDSPSACILLQDQELLCLRSFEIFAVGPRPAFLDHGFVHAAWTRTDKTNQASVAVDAKDFECDLLPQNFLFQRSLGGLAKGLPWKPSVGRLGGIDAMKPDLEFRAVCRKNRESVAIGNFLYDS